MSSINSLILIKTIIVFSYPIIVLIGLITNSISFMIFSRKRFQNTIFSTYYRCLIICQTMNLILPINKMFESNLNLFLSRISNFVCKLRFFYPNVNLGSSAWLLVAISFDRYLSISYPTKFMFRKQNSFQLLLSLFIICSNLGFFTTKWFYYLKETRVNVTNKANNQTYIADSFKCSSPGIWVQALDLVHLNLLPFLIMILFTSLTARHVFRSRKIINIISSSSSNKTSFQSNDRKFAIISISINILFLFLNLPQMVLFMINDYTNIFINLKDLYTLLDSFVYFLLYFNLITTFFINFYVNSMFKNELIAFIFNHKSNNLFSKSIARSIRR